jgi:hypothetical protein
MLCKKISLENKNKRIQLALILEPRASKPNALPLLYSR